jgi:hypothetical protein
VSVTPVLILLYMGYWIGAWVLGPRYYYEGLYSLTILTAAGIASLAGWPLEIGDSMGKKRNLKPWRPLSIAALVTLLVVSNIFFYLPIRIGDMRGLFGTSRQQLTPFQSLEVQTIAPALVIVDTEEWRAYAGLLELAHPMLDTPFIFIWDRGSRPNQTVIQAFPDRDAYYYNPDAGILSRLAP